MFWITFAYFFQGADPNQRSRLFLTRAILDEHSFDITTWHGYTIDKSEFAGAFRTDKAPGLSFLAVPIEAALRLIDRVAGLPSDGPMHDRVHLHTISMLVTGTAAVGVAYLVDRVLRHWQLPARERYVLVIGQALGTIAFPFATVFFSHALAAFVVIASYVLAIELDPKTPAGKSMGPVTFPREWKRLVLMGFLFSCAFVVEYPAILLSALIGLYALLMSPRAQWLGLSALVLLGAFPLLVGHAIYAKIAFGSAFELPYHFVFEPFFHVHHEEGLFGVSPPSPVGIYGVTVSRYRGIFFLCPFLVLVFWGLHAWRECGERRAEFRLVSAMLMAYFLFNASYYAWDGGGSTGPRHLVPALPFLVLPIAWTIRKSRAWFWITTVLVGVSVVFMTACVAVLIHHPMSDPMVANPLYDIVWPALRAGQLGLNDQVFMSLDARRDASDNLGRLMGMSPFGSLAFLAALWIIAYVPDLFFKSANPASLEEVTS